MALPYFPHSGRKPHLWKVRSEGYRDLLIKHGWGLRGGYAEKRIGRSWVMQVLVREEGMHKIYRFQRRDDLWSEITVRARDVDAKERRAGFRLVSNLEGESPQATKDEP